MKLLTCIQLALIFALAGCATTGYWLWTVTCFHNLDVTQGKTFAIIPLQKQYTNSLEFQAYAQIVTDKLSDYGLTRHLKEEMSKADFLIALDYGIGDPYQITYSYPMFGQVSGGTTHYSGTAYSGGNIATYSGTASTAPQYGVVGAGSRSITNYRQYVHLFIYDGKPAQNGDLVSRYEGKVEGAGYLHDLTKIVPSGLKALFVEFPGKSGSSRSERLRGIDQTP